MSAARTLGAMTSRRAVTVAAAALVTLTSCSGGSGRVDPSPTVNCDDPAISQEDWVKHCAQDEPPAPDPTDTPAADDALPLKGGTYRFSNGVEVTVKTQKVKRYGSHEPCCGDGYDPYSDVKIGEKPVKSDDLLIVIRYTVAVPKQFPQALDVTACSGTLSVDNGNDDDALTEVAGTYARSLDGRMRAGQTKYGVVEWAVRKRFADRTTFTYTNSCGDADGTGEAGTWSGKIKRE